MSRRFAIASLSLVLTGAGPRAWAAFEDNGTGARPTALGNAYATLGDDILSLYYNPAGLARIQDPQVSSEYSVLYNGLSDNSTLGEYMVSGGIPACGGVLGAGWKQLNLTSLYQERTFSLGYGRWFGTKLALGAAINQLHESFNAPNVTVDDNGNIVTGTPSLFTQKGTSKSAYSADLGALYRLGRYQWLGASVQNLNTPSLALDNDYTDRVARTWRGGWGYQDTHQLAFTGEYEFEEAIGGPQDHTITGAIEQGWNLGQTSKFDLRGAYSEGTRGLRRISTGFGLRIDGLLLDYAFVMDVSGIDVTNAVATHRISLSYRFSTASPGAVIHEAIPERPEQQEAKKKMTTPPPASSDSVISAPNRDLDLLLDDNDQPGANK